VEVSPVHASNLKENNLNKNGVPEVSGSAIIKTPLDPKKVARSDEDMDVASMNSIEMIEEEMNLEELMKQKELLQKRLEAMSGIEVIDLESEQEKKEETRPKGMNRLIIGKEMRRLEDKSKLKDHRAREKSNNEEKDKRKERDVQREEEFRREEDRRKEREEHRKKEREKDDNKRRDDRRKEREDDRKKDRERDDRRKDNRDGLDNRERDRRRNSVTRRSRSPYKDRGSGSGQRSRGNSPMRRDLGKDLNRDRDVNTRSGHDLDHNRRERDRKRRIEDRDRRDRQGDRNRDNRASSYRDKPKVEVDIEEEL